MRYLTAVILVAYVTYMSYTLLILSFPTDNATARMRAWRALKAAGAAVLRDGAYALPGGDQHRHTLEAVAADVKASGGQARVFDEARCDDDLETLFDRRDAYAAWMAEANELRALLDGDRTAEAPRALARLRRAFEQLAAIDFFPGEAQRQAAQALRSVEEAVSQALAPDEPRSIASEVPRLDRSRFRGRVWATRARPWVDRLASAWLIRRFIDPEARFLWLASPSDCPKRALGFDFDGATFTHVGARVTFETLLATFGLETPALLRVGTVVHAIDVGGVRPPEAAGIEAVLAGMREAITDDDQLLQAAAGVIEGLHVGFEKERTA
jgi:hypothetical protein